MLILELCIHGIIQQVLLHLASLTQHNKGVIIKISCVIVHAGGAFLSYCCAVFHRRNIPLSLLLIAFGLFSVWCHYEQAAMNMCVRPFGGHMRSCFAYITRSEIAGSKGRCIFVKANIISAIKEI